MADLPEYTQDNFTIPGAQLPGQNPYLKSTLATQLANAKQFRQDIPKM